MCNYNMKDTIKLSLESILSQIDDRFEVVLVDDGSTDSSVSCVKALQKNYTNLRLVELHRNSARKLGETRNISIRHATGRYVLVQLDCDDVYDPNIIDFITVFHQIETAIGHPFYLKGNKINIGERDFLLEHGPYRNIFRGEDRDMWARFSVLGLIVHLDHLPFFKRLPKSLSERFYRIIYHTWDHLENDFRAGTQFGWLMKRLTSRELGYPFRMRLMRLILAPFAYLSASRKKPISRPQGLKTNKEMKLKREELKASFTEIMLKYDAQPDFSNLSEKGREIFG